MSGAPLNVPPWSPYSKQLALPDATRAAIGTPPPSPLPRVMMSGWMPACSYAKRRPVRPMPVWISSTIRRMPASRVSCAEIAQPVVAGHEHAGLALDRLEHDRRGHWA